MIRFSDATFAELKEIRAFLYVRMYRHWAVQRMRRKARLVVEELFATFTAAPELMPADWNACAALDATGAGAGGRRLYRRHDRPLRAAGAPQADRPDGEGVAC